MLEIKLSRKLPGSMSVAESAEVFKINGRGLHNRHHDHQVTAFIGRCCDTVPVMHLHMSALPVVISRYPSDPVTRVEISTYDVIKIDYDTYRLMPMRHADPVLIPTRVMPTVHKYAEINNGYAFGLIIPDEYPTSVEA